MMSLEYSIIVVYVDDILHFVLHWGQTLVYITMFGEWIYKSCREVTTAIIAPSRTRQADPGTEISQV